MVFGACRGVGWAVALAFGKSSESRSRSRASGFAHDRTGSTVIATDPHGETPAGRRVGGACSRDMARVAFGGPLHRGRDYGSARGRPAPSRGDRRPVARI